MDTKEAIDILQEEIIYRHYNRPDITEKIFDEFEKNKQEIISMLKREVIIMNKLNKITQIAFKLS
ncbi:hypothetical protein LCGC14_2164460 [marine sediment metagenome]|uniref:Uncharacterized protein n=1 Tax=marine sediment metagenome TaxID=412755 RepID=A0A0F8Y1U9_9ZZZZ